MSPIQVKKWVLKTLPEPGLPFDFSQDSEKSTFQLVKQELSSSDLKDGEFLSETLYLSNDPAQKFWIASIDKNYSSGVQPGDVIPARGIARVIASKNPQFSVGAFVTGLTGWATHCIANSESQFRTIDATKVDELWWYLSVLGSTALTAYFIFYKYAGLQEREEDYGKTFLISGAAGAVGTVSVQLALHVFKASRVIAIAGGPEKVKYLKSFSDKVTVVDYKKESFRDDLLKAAGGPNTVDFFIDNVGGEILDLGTVLLKQRGTILACGSISGYNDPSKFVYKAYGAVITKRLTIKGLLVTDNISEFPTAWKKLAALVKEGYIDVTKSATIKKAEGDDFKLVPQIWNGLFSGINKGKLITQVKEA